MKIHIDIRDDITIGLAMTCVKQVIDDGKVSTDTKGNKYNCWATMFNTDEGKIVVSTRPYRKSDCFVVYKYKEHINEK